MRNARSAAVFAALLALAGCGSNESETAVEPQAEPTIAAPRTLIAADLDPASLGARVEGPDGPVVEDTITADGQELARIRSFVACPEGVSPCIPDNLPADTIYTYVHEVTLADRLPSTGSSAPETEGAATEIPASLFRMTRAATGFSRSVGYARTQAEAALGEPDAITVTLDEGQIIWRVTGGTGWKPSQPVTVWWQSTEPPAGPMEAFQLETNGMSASARGPFPPAEKAVDDAAVR